MEEIKKDYTASEFYKKVSHDLDFTVKDAIILVCAILIACIGLNMDSMTTVVGAMLISPLMTPILAIGVSGSLYSVPLFRKAIKIFLMEVSVSIAISTIYFWLSPISYASQQILSRTNTTIWDILIAFVGGIAGIIGAQKKEATNILPGVAIATTLMPPLCTMGYAISQANSDFFLGALYHFLSNCIFIILATVVGMYTTSVTKRMRDFRNKNMGYRKWFVIAAFVFAIPSLISAGQMVSESYRRVTVNQFLQDKLSDYTIVSRTYNAQENKLRLVLFGQEMTPEEEKALEEGIAEYGLAGMTMDVQQITNSGEMTPEELLEVLQNYQESQTVEEQIVQDLDAIDDAKLKEDKKKEEQASSSTESSTSDSSSDTKPSTSTEPSSENQ